jgi:ribose transport system ATP-binding protein
MPARFGFLNREKMRRRFEEVSQYAGIQLPSEKWLRFLSLAQREHVEILRALIHRPRLIVLDEPTAVLGKEESDHLLDLLRLLAREGTAVVFVSHYLDEVLSVADVVSVMRDGHLVSSGPAREQTVPSLIRSMVGRDIEQFYQDPVPVKSDAPVVLHAVGLGRGSAVNDVDITVHAGEIVGLAGLVGAGRSECARLLFGADRNDRGTIEIGLRQFRHLHPQTAMRLGVALVPESRRDDGLLMMRSVRENIGLASLRQHSRFGFIRRRAEREAAREVAAQCDIRMPGLGSPVRQLSGGNQQKALFARWMLRQPKVFIADEPTRGVDIGAKAQIHELILQMARDGIGVLLISSEVEEIVGLAHRVLVMRHGKIVDEVVRGEGNRERIIASAFGATLDGVA